MARGMSRRGSWASSPSVAAASKPANDNRPKTMPRNNVEVSVPGSILKTSRVSDASPGAEPAAILMNANRAITRMSSTVTPSMTSSAVVARRAGTMASQRTSSSARPPTTNPAQLGWSVQMSVSSRNCAPKTPVALAVTRP